MKVSLAKPIKSWWFYHLSLFPIQLLLHADSHLYFVVKEWEMFNKRNAVIQKGFSMKVGLMLLISLSLPGQYYKCFHSWRTVSCNVEMLFKSTFFFFFGKLWLSILTYIRKEWGFMLHIEVYQNLCMALPHL